MVIVTLQPARLRDYLRLARIDHVTKHVFILPGMVFALLLRPEDSQLSVIQILLGLLSATAVASANYVINEWLDRDFDKFHPEKSLRPAVQRRFSPHWVYLEYLLVLGLGLGLAYVVNSTVFLVALLFALSGVIYNVRPFRSKDIVFVDVLTESLNNPIRLMFGWAIVDPQALPPVSLLAGFWFGGAFLMNSKRLAEYRDICAEGGRELLGRYRRSFVFYTEERLLVANLLYAILCSFFVAIFLIKYKIEYVLMFPLISILFAEYLLLSLRSNSVARKPERLFKARRLVVLSTLNAVVFVLATLIEIPLLEQLTSQHFIVLTEGVDAP